MGGSQTDSLFVYGTLMTAAASSPLGQSQRAQLQAVSRSIGPATISGLLYDLGSYPALVADDAAGGRVHGEVLLLASPDATLAWLDIYEGIDADRPEANEYARIRRQVKLADGSLIEAWVYVYCRSIVGLPLIKSGRWQSA